MQPPQDPRSDAAGGLPADALCAGCDYSLVRLTERRCPECGRAFDPGDAASYRRGRPLGFFLRGLSRPPGRVLHALAGVAFALLMVAATMPDSLRVLPRCAVYGPFERLFMDGEFWRPGWETHPKLFNIGFRLWMLVGIAWGVRLAFRLFVARVLAATPGPGDGRRFLVAPMLFAAAGLLIWFEVPMRVGFASARGTLDDVVGQAERDGFHAVPSRHRAGVYEVGLVSSGSYGSGDEELELLAANVGIVIPERPSRSLRPATWFVVVGTSTTLVSRTGGEMIPTNGSGFVFCPDVGLEDGRMAFDHEMRFTRLTSDGWYAWSYRYGRMKGPPESPDD